MSAAIWTLLVLLWLAVIVLGSAWPEEPRPRRPHDRAHTTSHGGYTALELEVDGEHTDWLLRQAARIIGVSTPTETAVKSLDSAETLLDRACLVLGYSAA